MKLRLIEGPELIRLKPIFEKQGSLFDPQQLILSAIAEQDNKIIGCVNCNLIVNLGAIFVEPEFRNQGIATNLYKSIEDHYPKIPGSGYYMFPTTLISKHIAMKLGLKKLDWEVWRREY